jgi:sugar/nucleoside kinase (ribokinase family)
VLGDLMLDVVLAPARSLESGTDVPGRVRLVQGGSAANTARWLGRLGARATLIAAVGRDAAGRSLTQAVRADGVTMRVVRVAGARTGRIGVVLAPGGQRTFVADRGAADHLRPDDLETDWFAGADVVHLPVYSLLGVPLGEAGRRAIELGRATGAAISIDLASIGPLLARGRRAARSLIEGVAPDVLFATAAEADAFLGGRPKDRLLDYAAVAVVKRGAKGATVLVRDAGRNHRFEVATAPIAVSDTTGAGDAFDAGFLVAWITARTAGIPEAAALHRAALAGHRAAARQLGTPRQELPLV